MFFVQKPPWIPYDSTCPCLWRNFQGQTHHAKKKERQLRVGWAALFSISCQAKKGKVFFFLEQMNMGVSKNGGIPNWMVYNGKPY